MQQKRSTTYILVFPTRTPFASAPSSPEPAGQPRSSFRPTSTCLRTKQHHQAFRSSSLISSTVASYFRSIHPSLKKQTNTSLTTSLVRSASNHPSSFSHNQYRHAIAPRKSRTTTTIALPSSAADYSRAYSCRLPLAFAPNLS